MSSEDLLDGETSQSRPLRGSAASNPLRQSHKPSTGGIHVFHMPSIVAGSRLARGFTGTFVWVMLIAFTASTIQASSIDKEGLLSKYRSKFVVVINDGISTCFPSRQGTQETYSL